jgi:hypothetical protein
MDRHEKAAADSLVSLAASVDKRLVPFVNRSVITIDPHEALSILKYGPELQVSRDEMFSPFPFRNTFAEVDFLFSTWNPNFLDHFFFDEESKKWLPKLGDAELMKIRTARFDWIKRRTARTKKRENDVKQRKQGQNHLK